MKESEPQKVAGGRLILRVLSPFGDPIELTTEEAGRLGELLSKLAKDCMNP